MNEVADFSDDEVWFHLAELFGLLLAHFTDEEAVHEAPLVDASVDLLAFFVPALFEPSRSPALTVFLDAVVPFLPRTAFLRLVAALRRCERKRRENSFVYVQREERRRAIADFEAAKLQVEELRRARALEGYLRSREKARLRILAKKSGETFVAPKVPLGPKILMPVHPDVAAVRKAASKRAAQDMADFDRALGLSS